MERTPASIVSISESRVTVDFVQFPDCDGDVGLGVFQNVSGRVVLDFRSFTHTRGETISKLISEIDKDSPQVEYAIESAFDEDYWIVPTERCIKEGKIPTAFMVQHDSDNPTHYLDWEHDPHGRDFPYTFPLLIPFKPLPRNTELTFDYNKTSKKRGK